jgi:hypothetical protein
MHMVIFLPVFQIGLSETKILSPTIYIRQHEGPEKATRGGGLMGANQNSPQERSLYPKTNPRPLSSNTPKTD